MGYSKGIDAAVRRRPLSVVGGSLLDHLFSSTFANIVAVQGCVC